MSSYETELYLEFEQLSEIIKDLQALIEYKESNACDNVSRSHTNSTLRSNNAFYFEINNAIFDNMIDENVFSGPDRFCDAAENYALMNQTKMEDAFKPKESELAQFKMNFIKTPFIFNTSSHAGTNDLDERDNLITLADAKHLLPAFLVTELEFGTEGTCDTQSPYKMTPKKSVAWPKVDPTLQNYYKSMTEASNYAAGSFNAGTMQLGSPVRHPFYGYPAFMGCAASPQQQQRFNQNFMYYARSPIPPPGFPAYQSTINQLKKERQKKIEELIHRDKERNSVLETNVTLKDSLGVDVLKDDDVPEEGDADAY